MIGFPDKLVDKADALLARCRMRSAVIATAESCTGGLVAGLLTAISGSSESFDRAFVTYSNEAKMEMLGIDAGLLQAHGAVSSQCAREMVMGTLAHSRATLAVSITGIAGPAGGTLHKPVGLVHFAALTRGGQVYPKEHRFGNIGRHDIRLAAIEVALDLLRDQLA